MPYQIAGVDAIYSQRSGLCWRANSSERLRAAPWGRAGGPPFVFAN